MSILKRDAGINTSAKRSNAGRRSFMWKAGAATSALIASAAAGASNIRSDPNASLREQVDRLSNRIGRLKDANAIRRIHRTYESHLDQGLYEKVVEMFFDDGEVIFNGGLFSGKEGGVRRLFCRLFSSGMTGKKLDFVPGFGQGPAQDSDIVEVAVDRKSAKGQFPFSMQVGKPMNDDSTLVKMARLQGQGIAKWWEGGICEAFFLKIGDIWKIKRLEYRVFSRADYRPGQSYARPINVPEFANTYPEDPAGPDKLV
jgi:hypothetical protein